MENIKLLDICCLIRIISFLRLLKPQTVAIHLWTHQQAPFKKIRFHEKIFLHFSGLCANNFYHHHPHFVINISNIFELFVGPFSHCIIPNDNNCCKQTAFIKRPYQDPGLTSLEKQQDGSSHGMNAHLSDRRLFVITLHVFPF